MRRLADAGMTTREACGNSVRNITACPYAGVARDELFDVTPYAEATDALPAAPSAQLHAAAQVQDCVRGLPARTTRPRRINDLGWRAALHRRRTGRRGFRVTVAGGTAIMLPHRLPRSTSSCPRPTS